MKKMMAWALAALLIPGVAVGAEEKAEPLEVYAPSFSYYSFGTEAARLVSLGRDDTPVAGGLFVLEEGYLSVGYELDNDVYSPFPAGKPLTCLNEDLSVRWVLEDERLSGAWYLSLLELPDALLLGDERSAPGAGQAYSLMLVDKATGAVRWQREGAALDEDAGMVWIGKIGLDAGGNILVTSNGNLDGKENGAGTLSLLDAGDGSTLWSVEYLTEYGVWHIWDLCPLGDGLLLRGIREDDQVLLYTDGQGAVRGWFAFRPWENDSTQLWLASLSEDVAYLGGWEMQESYKTQGDELGAASDATTLQLMRITQETFLNAKRP